MAWFVCFRPCWRIGRSKVAASPPLLSVVIPCYNGELWLSRAIDSILTQQCDWVEVVVVNDGSTDGTGEIMAGYGSRIVPVQQANSGVARARRTGVRSARGEYVKFLDADDVIPTGALSALSAFIHQFPGEALLGRAQEITEDGEIAGNRMYVIGYTPEHLSLLKNEYLLTQATHSSLWTIPRSLFETKAIFCESPPMLGEEYDFCIRLIESGIPIRYIDQVVSFIRGHAGVGRLSSTRDETRHLRQARQLQTVATFITERLPGHEPCAILRLAELAWSQGRHCLRMQMKLAAAEYFRIAREINPEVEPVGSRTYRVLSLAYGPERSERILECAKKLNAVRKRWR